MKGRGRGRRGWREKGEGKSEVGSGQWRALRPPEHMQRRRVGVHAPPWGTAWSGFQVPAFCLLPRARLSAPPSEA